MREIVLDTETTGLDPKKGDRLIEVGCIEIFNRIPTGREFHRFINPERDVPIEAQNIHGISTEFLAGKPLFREVARDFLAFIGDDTLVIHNAQFDVMFLNHELGLVGEKAPEFRQGRRHACDCTPPPSGRTEFARCALQAIRNRQFATDQARRFGRQPAAGGGLRRAAWRTAGDVRLAKSGRQ